MKTVRLTTLGRMGNNLFRWSFAKALCEQNNYELRTDPWPGESIFTLDGYEPKRPDGTEDIVIEGYHQCQDSLIYSRADCRRWFELKPWVKYRLSYINPSQPHAHLRRGDYKSAGYPIIGVPSIERAMLQYEINPPWVSVTDDKIPGRFVGSGNDPEFTGELSFVPDFVRLMRAPILFRGNSSFSWWASTLGTGLTFSPVITGLAGGVEHDNVPFVEGNHSRLAELPGITELHLRET